jgi:hypothetical protein
MMMKKTLRFASTVAGSPGEVLSSQPIRRCCIDRLSWQGKPETGTICPVADDPLSTPGKRWAQDE